MKVFEVLESLKKGEKLKEIAIVLGINNSTLQRKLKALGYAFDSSTKEWFYNNKDNPEPLEENIMDMVKRNSKSGVNDSPRIIQGNKSRTKGELEVKHGNTVKESEVLTGEDIADLHEMLLFWRTDRERAKRHKTLHEEIKTLKRDDRTRKTVILSKEVAKRLDKLSERERFDKSDLLELALEHFLSEYE
ncbi:ribbon-helix-helix domain-containing protein [Bacillus paranthracis]